MSDTVVVNTTANTVTVVAGGSNTVTVGTTANTVTVNTPAAMDILDVVGQGPQGPPGPQGPTGPQGPAGDASNIALSALTDVDVSAKTDGSLLAYDNTATLWKATNAPTNQLMDGGNF